jgi:hypothetical protein
LWVVSFLILGQIIPIVMTYTRWKSLRLKDQSITFWTLFTYYERVKDFKHNEAITDDSPLRDVSDNVDFASEEFIQFFSQVVNNTLLGTTWSYFQYFSVLLSFVGVAKNVGNFLFRSFLSTKGYI